MRRVAVTFGMLAAVALANPASAALQLPHDFFDEPGPRPIAPDFNMIGNLPHGLGYRTNDVLGGQVIPFGLQLSPHFELGSDQNDIQLGGNGVPLFNVRFDPGHDFYNSLTAQIAVSSVPEPQTWMMLLLGFAAIGFAIRRDRSPKTSASRTVPRRSELLLNF